MAGSDENVRSQAASWFARMRAPDGEKDRAAFEAWRAADPRHAATYRRLEENWRHSALLRDSELAVSFRSASPWWARLNLDRPRALAAAVAALALLGAVGIWLTAHHGPSADLSSAYASRVGEIRTVSLADGSRVTLDTGSAITDLSTAGERTIRLDRGRARFNVVHDASRPFVVLAGTARITDKGTLFDVRCLDGRVEIVLLRGSVEVRSIAPAVASNSASPLILTAGQRGTFTADRLPDVAQLTDQGQPNWVSGMLDFSDAPLSDVLAEINSYNKQHIILGDPRLANLRVTGAYRANAPEDDARNLAALFQLSVAPDANGKWILLPSRAGR